MVEKLMSKTVMENKQERKDRFFETYRKSVESLKYLSSLAEYLGNKQLSKDMQHFATKLEEFKADISFR